MSALEGGGDAPIASVPVNVPRVDVGIADVPVELAPRTRAGVSLARYVMWGGAGFVFVVLVLVGLSEWQLAAEMGAVREGLRTAPDSLSLLRQSTLLDATAKAQAASRAFWLEIVQTVLLNAFLPILTALLGYIFGSKEA